MTLKRIARVGFLAFLLSGCQPEHKPFDGRDDIEVPQKLVESVSFNELYNRVLEPKCIGCHGSSGNVNLETYQGARAAMARIQRSVLNARQMPKTPFTPLDREQLQLVAAWIKAGGPELPVGGGVAPDTTKLEPTFASIRTKIIEAKCVACHRTGGEAPRVPLNTIADMVNSPLEIIIPGNPDESGLMIVIQPNARKKMPPSNSGIGALKPNEIQTINDWIAQGANN